MFLETLVNENKSALVNRLAFDHSNGALDTATTTIPTIETNHNNLLHATAHPNNSPHQANSFHHQPAGDQELPCFNDLIAVLIECFALITIGYLSCRFKVISPEAKDLGAYLTTFALPMIIFLNVAQMEIKTINLSLLVCMLISKLIIFALVSLITLAITYPTNFGYAGALSILTTQSNDFALGYPLFKSLYGKSRPEMLNYLNLMGPIQLLIINPLGIVMLEFGKSRMRRRMRREQARAGLNGSRPVCGYCLASGQQQLCRPTPSRLEPMTEEANRGDEQEDCHEEMFRKSRKLLILANPTPAVPIEQQVSTSNGISKPLSPSLLSQQSFDSRQAEGLPISSQRQQVSEECSLRGNWLAGVGLNQPICTGRPPPPASCTCLLMDQTNEEPIIDLGFLKALMTNPLIIMSLLALAVNLIHGPELPKFVTKVSGTIAASFAAPALLVVGLSMYGKFKLILSNPNDLLLASVLVITKGMILPNVMRTVMQVALPYYVEPQEIQSLVDFSYLYGLLPTAPGACIIAKQYEILTNVVSLGMLLSTIVSAPLMLGTSAVISKANSITPEAVIQTMSKVLTVSSSVTLVLSLLTLYSLWKSNGHTARFLAGALRDATALRSRHLFTILLTITQLLVGLGGFMWLFIDLNKLKSHPIHSLKTLAQDVVKADPLAGDVASTTSIHWQRVDADYEDEDNYLDQNRQHELMTTTKVHGILTAGGNSLSITSLACTVGFIHASGGLLLTRFLIGCIVVTNFIRKFRGHQLAGQVSTLITRLFPLFVMAIVMCLVFESNHLTCKPTEPSLPRWTFSLYFRLLFNVILLFMTISLFVITFRLSNKRAHQLRAGCSVGNETERHLATTINSPLKKRPFVASNVSLVSGTSSEITTSTGINETTAHIVALKTHDNGILQACSTDSDTEANLMFDYRRLYVQKSESFSSQGSFKKPDKASKCQSMPSGDDVASLNADHLSDLNNNHHFDDFMLVHSSSNNWRSHGGAFHGQGGLIHGSAAPNEVPETSPVLMKTWSNGSGVEFDRNCILVVFMLFQALLSSTSIVQIISQSGSPLGGTFIIVELTNLIVDFGQGLLTFLVLGTQVLTAFDTTQAAPPADQTLA